MRDRTKHNNNTLFISLVGMFIFFLLTPIKTYADQPTTPTPSPTPTSLEIQRATVGIKGRVLSSSDYDVIVPINKYFKVVFNTSGGSIVNEQVVKKGEYAVEPPSPTKENFTFSHWILKNTNQKFNFSTPITSNITLVAVWTSSSPSSPSPSDENKPNTDKEDTNSSGDNNNEEDKKDTSEDSENNGEDKEGNSDNKDNNSETKDEISEDNGEDSKSSDNSKDNSDNNNGLNDTSEETTEESSENTESIESNDGLINTHTNPSSNHSKTSTPSIETDPDIATNTETTDLLSEIKATVLGVFKTISKSITIVAKISLIGILIWFIWFVVLLNNTLVKIQSPSEDQSDQSQRQSKRQRKSWKTVYLTPIKKTIEQTDEDKRTVWSLSLPQNLLDDNEELKVKIPWSVYHRAEDENQANQTELHITITPDQPDPMMIYIITNETKEIKIK